VVGSDGCAGASTDLSRAGTGIDVIRDFIAWKVVSPAFLRGRRRNTDGGEFFHEIGGTCVLELDDAAPELLAHIRVQAVGRLRAHQAPLRRVCRLRLQPLDSRFLFAAMLPVVTTTMASSST